VILLWLAEKIKLGDSVVESVFDISIEIAFNNLWIMFVFAGGF